MTSQTPPGWYADPQDSTRWRWWDGSAWTDAISDPAAAQQGPLWTAATLWVDTRARVGSWEADVVDESGQGAGTVRGGIEMVVSEAAGSPLLRVKAERQESRMHYESLGRLHVSDASGSPVGSLEVVQYVNAQVTLSLRDTGGQELAVLAPEAKNDREFALTRADGAPLGRVVAVETSRKLLSQDRKWWVNLNRPLDQPLNSLALAVSLTLSNIQLMVVNWADQKFK